jgi:hypothetical protein
MKKENINAKLFETIPSQVMVNALNVEYNNTIEYIKVDDFIEYIKCRYPYNSNYNEIFTKVTIINSLYSTQIYPYFLNNMVNHILRLNIDTRLYDSVSAGKNDLKLITDIATGHGIMNNEKAKESNLFSFATKYCALHKENFCPIYDSNVYRALRNINAIKKFADFKFTYDNIKIKDINIFSSIIENFQSEFTLEDYSLRKIDKFLWLYGKKLLDHQKEKDKEKRNSQM